MAVITINGTSFNPSAMTIGIMDVSAPDAGRDQSGKMYKMLITSKRKIEVEWWYPSPTLTKSILTAAMSSEYVTVGYTDPYTNAWTTKTMYVGDRSAPVEMWGTNRKLYNKVSFSLIER